MSLTFIIPRLFIYTQKPDLAAPPRLEPYHLEWLEDAGIKEWELSWAPRERDPSPLPYATRFTMWDTSITFKDPKDALLWKLRWA